MKETDAGGYFSQRLAARRERLTLAAGRAAIKTLVAVCRDAWQKGLLDGLSGNASVRLGEDRFVVTASGVPKGRLDERDFAVLDLTGRLLRGSKKPSSEWRLHAALYRRSPLCRAVLHTHPPALQALENGERLAGSRRALDEILASGVDLYEARYWLKRFVAAPDAAPGGEETGESAAEALARPREAAPLAVWLPRHGLAAMGETLADAYSVTEELEHLASVSARSRALNAIPTSRAFRAPARKNDGSQ